MYVCVLHEARKSKALCSCVREPACTAGCVCFDNGACFIAQSPHGFPRPVTFDSCGRMEHVRDSFYTHRRKKRGLKEKRRSRLGPSSDRKAGVGEGCLSRDALLLKSDAEMKESPPRNLLIRRTSLGRLAYATLKPLESLSFSFHLSGRGRLICHIHQPALATHILPSSRPTMPWSCQSMDGCELMFVCVWEFSFECFYCSASDWLCVCACVGAGGVKSLSCISCILPQRQVHLVS